MSRYIYGKVDWTDGGKIKFGEPPCDTRVRCIYEDLEGCIEWTGVHAGQVKVIISLATLEACNDTYYGCVDWTTGKFRITIPDTCCQLGDPCNFCKEDDPPYTHYTPPEVELTLTGLTDCGCFSYDANGYPWSISYSDYASFNGVYTLPQGSEAIDWCKWIEPEIHPGGVGCRRSYTGYDCAGVPYGTSYEYTLYLLVERKEFELYVFIGGWDTGASIFKASAPMLGEDPCATKSNIDNELVCDETVATYGGQVDVEGVFT